MRERDVTVSGAAGGRGERDAAARGTLLCRRAARRNVHVFVLAVDVCTDKSDGSPAVVSKERPYITMGDAVNNIVNNF